MTVKKQRIPVLVACIFFICAVLLILPLVTPVTTAGAWAAFSRVVAAINEQSALMILGERLSILVLPILFVVWAVFLLVTRKKHHFWWMVPYSAIVYYTFYLFSQLQSGNSSGGFFLERLSQDPGIGLLLLAVLLLFELAIFILATLLSVRLYRRSITKQAQMEKKADQQKEEEAMVVLPSEKQEPSVVQPLLESGDEELVFPEIQELPTLKTIGKRRKKTTTQMQEGLYVGSVRMAENSPMVLTETPVPLPDEIEEEPLKESFDPLASLQKQKREYAVAAQSEEKEVFTPPLPQQAAADQPQEDAGALPISDEEEIEMIWGVGGLVSSNAGPSALLAHSQAHYTFPSADLLESYPNHSTDIDEATRAAGVELIHTLKQFKIDAKLVNIVKGPTVTRYEVSPSPGVRVSAIVSLSDNIALQLASRQVRIVAPIPGKQAVGIEVPNKVRSIIGFREMLPSMERKDYQLPIVLGRKITGEPVVVDLTQTPHLLIAGATGSGKSVCVNSLICSILFCKSPKEVRLLLVDPKIVEMRVFNGIPHLLAPVITEPKKTIKALEFCLFEMERRYKLLNALAVRNIAGYNKKIGELKLARERLPFIVLVIDEFADLMTTVGKELETLLARLAAMARAVGIHLVLATQRPSANIITGIIKSNIPTRIAFMVASQIDSRIIIDEMGAEKLMGKGDMLFSAGWDPNSVRLQGAFLSDEEVERVVDFVKKQGEPDYLDEAFFEEDDHESDEEDEFVSDSDDVLMEKALRIVVERQSASASYLQRRLKIGYNRAARLVEQMEEMGYVGPARGSKPRELLKYPESL